MQFIFYRSKRSETDNAPGTKKPRKINVFRGLNSAGDGNRTHVSSLECWCSTIELHPHIRYVITILTNRCYHTTEEPESQRKN